MKYILLGLLFSVSITITYSQTAIPRESIILNENVRSEFPTPPIVDLPYIDNNKEYERLISESPNHGDIVGTHIPVDISTSNSGIWSTLSNGNRVWQLRIKSETAKGLRFICDKFELTKSTYLYFKDNLNGKIYGAYSYLNNQRETGVFATGFFNTNDITIIIEIDEIQNNSFPKIHFDKISHGLKTEDFGLSASCNNDVNCSPWVTEWCNEIRATVQLIFETGSNDERCTGVLLNSTDNNFTPYILTSGHCYSGAVLSTSIVIYNFQSPTCTPQQNGNDLLRTVGLVDLWGSDEASIGQNLCHNIHDALLLRALNGSFPTPMPWNYNVFYAGWDKRSMDKGTEVMCIHHPKGDVKKISEGVLETNNRKCWRVDFTNGIVESGSSGSPLFEENHRVIGNLSRANLAPSELNCTDDFIARYGKLRKYFDDIDGWIAPGSSLNFIDGSDPLGACQNDLLLYGRFYPANDWQLKNDILIQAQNTITAAPNEIPTIIGGSDPLHTNLNNSSDYTFRAGQSVTLKDGFKVVRGNRFKAEIGECEAFEGCGFNYQERVAPIKDEKEENVSLIDVIDKNASNVEKGNLTIYPNPTDNLITIKSTQSYHLDIFNLMGQNVGQEQGSIGNLEYNMARFEQGIYIFRFQFEDGTSQTIKVVKR